MHSTTSHFADRAIMSFINFYQHQPHLDCPQWVCQGVADKEPQLHAPSCLQLSLTDLDYQILGYLHHQLQDQMGYKETVQQYGFNFQLLTITKLHVPNCRHARIHILQWHFIWWCHYILSAMFCITITVYLWCIWLNYPVTVSLPAWNKVQELCPLLYMDFVVLFCHEFSINNDPRRTSACP